jgi:hypothetical protein
LEIGFKGFSLNWHYEQYFQILKINTMQKFQELKNLIASLEGDADKFYTKGNSAAGTRVRKGMQDLKNIAQAIRAEVQEIKNKA